MIHVPEMVSEEREREMGTGRWFCSVPGVATLTREPLLEPAGKLGVMREYFTL